MEEEEDIHRYSQQGQGNLMWTRTQEDVPEPFISLKAFEVTGVQLNTNRDLGDSTTGCSQAQGGRGPGVERTLSGPRQEVWAAGTMEQPGPGTASGIHDPTTLCLDVREKEPQSHRSLQCYHEELGAQRPFSVPKSRGQ